MLSQMQAAAQIDAAEITRNTPSVFFHQFDVSDNDGQAAATSSR